MSETAIRATPSGQMVAEGFGRAAGYYEEHATVQRFAANRLATFLDPLIHNLPSGPILEIGCGTGFVSRHLSRLCPDRDLELTDLSPRMLSFCRAVLAGHHGGLSFREADAEWIENAGPYALVVGGFVAQWFGSPGEGLARLARLLAPGGILVASFPGMESFPEWREACMHSGVEYTGLSLPVAEDVADVLEREGMTVDVRRELFVEHYPSPLHFFRHLRNIGAAPNRGEPLTSSQMRALLRSWKREKGSVEYQVVTLLAQTSSHP